VLAADVTQPVGYRKNGRGDAELSRCVSPLRRRAPTGGPASTTGAHEKDQRKK